MVEPDRKRKYSVTSFGMAVGDPTRQIFVPRFSIQSYSRFA